MKMSRRWYSNHLVTGEICTIVLHASNENTQFDATRQESLQNCYADLEPQIRNNVSQSLGPHFTVSNLMLLAESFEIRMKIACSGERFRDYDKFAKVLDSLVSQLCSLLRWVGHPLISAPSGHWYPEASLTRLQFSAIDERKPILELSQQPISLLLLGTLFGSILIPYFNDRSNRQKLRHEERVKVAIMIIEQSHETDQHLSNLMDYLVLFRKDHDALSKEPGYFQKEQHNARKVFNEMYLSSNSQAWSWHWNVKSESSLSALATPGESKRMSQLARQYSDALGECIAAVTSLWNPFLKNPYDPLNPQYNVLIKKASDDLTRARQKKDAIALEMARMFASG